jgi:hypothetical protein
MSIVYSFYLHEHESLFLTSRRLSLLVLLLSLLSQIDFDKRKEDEIHNDCLMSIDSTDFQIYPKGSAVKGNAYASHKYAGKSALRYELGICIWTGHLVWIKGPYAPGQWNDITIFNNCLARVEADSGYPGHATKSSAQIILQITQTILQCRRASGLIMRHSMEN